ncbi:MAG: hypothetical protein QY319_02590 [Candidatus Kapaibacterium sp.]|nr:MAG: hypothetical protein QY319_02590 [Candidatus Kapabacteria bacterium]
MPVTNDLIDLHHVILACMGWTGTEEFTFYRGHDNSIINENNVMLLDMMHETSSLLHYVYEPYKHLEFTITFGQRKQSTIGARSYHITEAHPPIVELPEMSAYIHSKVTRLRESYAVKLATDSKRKT